MKTTTVKVAELIEILITNRAKHDKDYQEAMQGWQQAVSKALTKAAKQASREKNPKFNVNPCLGLPKPAHHLTDYDTALARLHMEVSSEVELDEREFNAYVLDKFDWREVFAGVTSTYNNRG